MESTQSLHREASQSTLSIHVEPKQESVSTATPLLDLKDATLIPQGWPTSPSRIKHPVSTMLLHGALDIALFASSACFLVFSLVVMHYNDALTSENPTATSVLTRATKYGPTIFPLLFASVVGRATHAILLWRLEKGERIQILDTLATSTSLTATVTSQIQLRQLSVLSALLIVIWALSPIGGQASLRQMSVEMMLNRSDSTFRYVVPGKMFSHGGSGYSTVNNLFVSALYASPSTNASTVDLWGNVKIPRIEHYEDIAEPDSDGWFETRLEEHYLAAYTSFVGITIDGAQNKTTTTDYDFHLQTEYFHLACSSINDTKTSLPPDARNVSGQGGFFWWSGNDMENRWNRTLETLKPFNLSYNPGLDSEVWKLKPDGVSCSIKNSYVEVEVLCALNSTCRAVKVRRSQLPQLSSALTFMDFDLEDFMAAFMSSIGGKRGTALASPLGNYLTDPSLSIAHETIVAIYEDPKNTKISDKAWSERIGQLLNSYWTCAYGSYSVTGGILNATSYFWDTNITFVPPKVDFDRPDSADTYNWTSDMDLKTKVWSTQGNKTEHIEVIVAHKSWAITLAIASLVLIAFSIVTLLVRHFLTNGPDIAMNFSSLATRNNNHVPIPAGGSFLPASDRFRLLKDLRLRFADAEGKSDVGNLVIAAQGIEKAGYSRVRKGRLYE